MPDEKRHADALGIYLTGASSDGGSQASAAASLGNYRSSTELTCLGHLAHSAIAPLVIDRVGSACGEGDAILRADAAGSVRFTPPGGSEGAAVAIANGDTKWVEGADDDTGVRVRRRSASSLHGAMTLDLRPIFNNPVAGGNVANAHRVAGGKKYRALMLSAHGAYGVLDVYVWIGAGSTQATVKVALEAADSDGKVQTIADEDTAPAGGVSFSAPANEGAGLHIGTLDVSTVQSRNYALWIERDFPSAGDAAIEETVQIEISYWGA